MSPLIYNISKISGPTDPIFLGDGIIYNNTNIAYDMTHVSWSATPWGTGLRFASNANSSNASLRFGNYIGSLDNDNYVGAEVWIRMPNSNVWTPDVLNLGTTPYDNAATKFRLQIKNYTGGSLYTIGFCDNFGNVRTLSWSASYDTNWMHLAFKIIRTSSTSLSGELFKNGVSMGLQNLAIRAADTFIYSADSIKLLGGYTEYYTGFAAIYNHVSWNPAQRYSAGPLNPPTDAIGYIDFKEIAGATTKLKSLMA